MSKQHHYLKTRALYFQDTKDRLKNFELRKNDRDFKQGDILHLEETVGSIKTGREITRTVRYIFYGGKYGLKKGYCIMDIS